ncbi:type IV pilus modification protein PilV [Chromohalobacter japonicus]|uniref:Type IV pilus modification protein PilV n=1 Tax=Chromohalobacter japonicus TaxID=223900 RepID=A0A1Q8TEX4_9GAMM|nr:type IV pilus modification protein PilV [Chromohalobacter japonicus]OLO12178.1 type IV pilus modification protein PilV [Chromohalobacter japonicus]
MMAPPLQRPPRAQSGFGLIEVLVALTILSVGMLGLAAMQLNSLQNARDSLNTTLATIMVRDMNERAWAQQDETCEALLSEWQKDVAKIDGLPSPHGSWPDDVDNGLYDLEITWQGRGDPDDADYEPPHVNLVAFLPCKGRADD